MKLSKRLETVASFVPKGSNIADIGTDHGYVPIYLIQEEIADHAVAMDVRKGPLERAAAHIREAGLEERIEVRLSDGLAGLKAGEADCVIIAGMGGELILHILEAGRALWDTIGCWVLSPQSELDKVRRFLKKQSFFVVRETMIEEDGKYYTVMGVMRSRGRKGAGAEAGFEAEAEKEVYYRYGRLPIREKNPVLLEYLKKEREQLEQIKKTLEDSPTPGAMRRLKEVCKELSWNEEAQDEMLRTDTEA